MNELPRSKLTGYREKARSLNPDAEHRGIISIKSIIFLLKLTPMPSRERVRVRGIFRTMASFLESVSFKQTLVNGASLLSLRGPEGFVAIFL